MGKLTELLNKTPDVDAFWGKCGKPLEMMGFKKSDVTTVEAMTDLRLIAKAMDGDIPSKKYLDERAAAERRAQQWEPKKKPKP